MLPSCKLLQTLWLKPVTIKASRETSPRHSLVFLRGVFLLLKLHWFFCLPPDFLPCLLVGQFEFCSFSPCPFQLSKDLAHLMLSLSSLMVVPIKSSSQACTCLNCFSTFKRASVLGRAFLALLENVPYTLTPPTFALLILHWSLSFIPGEFMYKAEVSPSDVLNEWESEKRNQGSHIKTRHTKAILCILFTWNSSYSMVKQGRKP